MNEVVGIVRPQEALNTVRCAKSCPKVAIQVYRAYFVLENLASSDFEPLPLEHFYDVLRVNKLESNYKIRRQIHVHDPFAFARSSPG